MELSEALKPLLDSLQGEHGPLGVEMDETEYYDVITESMSLGMLTRLGSGSLKVQNNGLAAQGN